MELFSALYLRLQAKAALRLVQNECQVSLNTVENLEGFIADINSGRWDQVLPVIAQLKLPRNKVEDIYEQVCPLIYVQFLHCLAETTISTCWTPLHTGGAGNGGA